MRAECVAVRSVNGLYDTVHRSTLTYVDVRQRTLLYSMSTCGLYRHTQV